MNSLVQIFILTNGRDTVIETLNSVLSQTYQKFTVVVSDNSCSFWIKSYVEKMADIRFSYIERRNGKSLADNIDSCLSAVKDDFFVLMHDDDVFHPTYLQKMLDAFECNPSAQWGVSNALIFNDKVDCPLRAVNSRSISDFFSGRGVSLFARILAGNPVVIMPAVFYRSSALKSLLFDHQFIAIGDLLMWLKLALSQDFVYVSDPVFYYRIHDNNHSVECALDGTFMVEALRLLDWIKTLWDNGDLPDFDYRTAKSEVIRSQFKILVWACIRHNKYILPQSYYKIFSTHLSFPEKIVLFLVRIRVIRVLLRGPGLKLKRFRDSRRGL